MKKRVCGNCFERAVVPNVKPFYKVDLRHDGCNYTVSVASVKINQCEECGNYNLTDESSESLDDALRVSAGILFPDQIRQIREEFNFSQEKMAELIRVPLERYIGYESGMFLQTRSVDLLFRAMAHSQDFRDFFEVFAIPLQKNEYT